ncbi:low temperature requirement protein A [Alloalcanivorax gelatiniphagus]
MSVGAIHRPMRARAPDEPHRTATPLELLFDLAFVVAVSQAAGRLAHATLDGHALSATAPFLMVFFAIWWAWMNFTWFASAYDTDDLTYRLAAFVQIGGVLVLAGGVGRAFDGDLTAVTLGFLIMRFGLISLWLRAAVQHPRRRRTALRYATGISALEVLWVARLALGDHAAVTSFIVLALLELLVPIWSERAGSTSWHPHHIAERYSLFTIILLGEGILAATNAVVAVLEKAAGANLAIVSATSLVILAALWWLCFAISAGDGLKSQRHWSFVWGYGYYIPFAGLAALGAGLEVIVASQASGSAHVSSTVAVASVAVPVGIVILVIDLLRAPLFSVDPQSLVRGILVAGALAAAVAASERLGSTGGLCLVALTAAVAVLANSIKPLRSVR